jgi:hypothetical protein
MKRALVAVTAGLVALGSTLSGWAEARYVDVNSTNATPPFTNWTTAATSIQDAVDAADAGDEIVVTNGVYQTGGAVAGSATNRVALTRPVVVRSVNGPQTTTITGSGIMRCAYLTNGASLSGFTLANGVADGGGGVAGASADAVVSNCLLTANLATGGGGGARGVTLNNCTLSGNSAGFGGGARDCTLNECTLTSNTAGPSYGQGGGAYQGTLNRCIISENSAYKAGGGAFSGTLNNCTLTGNTVTYGGGTTGDGGGGAYGATLNNCTVVGNSNAQWGGGGVQGGTMNNCIIYYHRGQNYAATCNNCCTTPLPGTGTGNFTNEPLFVDGELRLQINSPCINVGNNAYVVGTKDLAGRHRIVSGTVDVGAYEYQGPYLNVTATAGGSVTRNPDQPDYPPGSLATLTATPQTGYGFIRWTGDATGSTNPLTVVMSTNKSITAVFASTALTLATQGVGTIAKAPDKAFYDVGEAVTLSATAGRWHVFTRWTDGNTSNPRTVTIGESNAYTAVFTPTTPLDSVTIGGVSRLAPVGMPAVVVDGLFILTPSASARGSALVELATTFPGGTLFYTLDDSDPAASGMLYAGPFTVGKPCLLRTIAYNADFTQSVPGDPVSIVLLPTLTAVTDGGGSVAVDPPTRDYFRNSLAVVTATAAPGWTFLQWLGDASGTNPVVNLTMTRSKTVRAVFGTALNRSVVGGGSIAASPVSPLYPYGSQVRLTPVPATGNYHALWANAAAGRTNNPLTFTVTNANPTVTAVFASLGTAQTNALTVIPDGRGQVTLTPPGNRYRLNTNVVLQATADRGQEFLGWSGAASGSQNPLTVTMNSNKVITASFTKRPWLSGEGNPDMLAQDGFRLTLTGEFGAAYEFLGSTDFSNWTPLGTVTNDWGTAQFIDTAATNAPANFYRALGQD